MIGGNQGRKKGSEEFRRKPGSVGVDGRRWIGGRKWDRR